MAWWLSSRWLALSPHRWRHHYYRAIPLLNCAAVFRSAVDLCISRKQYRNRNSQISLRTPCTLQIHQVSFIYTEPVQTHKEIKMKGSEINRKAINQKCFLFKLLALKCRPAHFCGEFESTLVFLRCPVFLRCWYFVTFINYFGEVIMLGCSSQDA